MAGNISKICTQCNVEKSLDCFHKNKATKDKRQSHCKDCGTISTRLYRFKNKDHINEYDNKRYRKNREKRLNYARKIPKEITRERSRKLRKEQPEKAKLWKRNYYEKNKDKVLQKSKEYALKNPRKIKEQSLKRTYGLSLDFIEKEEITQEHKCLICKKQDKLVVDHCHTTLKYRGLLCGNCNRGLGQFKDNEDNLLNAIEYLRVRK